MLKKLSILIWFAIIALVFNFWKSSPNPILNAPKTAEAIGTVTITGVQVNNSAVKVQYSPVAGAKDFRIYDITNPNNVKYAGLTHISAGPDCPGSGCFQHFLVQADGVTPVFPYQATAFSYPNGGSGGPQVLDVPATEIDYNSVGDNAQHTLVVEAVDQLGPVPKANLYNGDWSNTPLAPGGMLGSNKGITLDGKTSTNGQGPYTNNPQVIAQSQPFIVQANPNYKVIPSTGSATQTFFDTFDNSEASTMLQTSRNDDYDAFGNLGSMTYTLNANTSKAWDIFYRQANNRDSMPFIAADHFMDMLFDGATPGNVHGAPTRTIYGSMSMSPVKNIDITGGKILHMTLEIDGHVTINRRWWDFNLSPASDLLQSWDYNGFQLNNNNQGMYLEFKDGKCTLNMFNGPASATKTQVPAATSASIPCDWSQRYINRDFSKNGLGFDDKSRYDLFISQTHLAVFEDGQMISQANIPAGTFSWSSQPLRAYFTHYVYHSDVEGPGELKVFSINGQNFCYPMNSFMFNDPVNGTPASGSICNIAYPAGYGFPYSDERHWDNMGLEVLPSTITSATDFASLASLVQPPTISAVTYTTNPTPTPSPTPTPTPTPIVGDINTDHIVNSIDYSILNSDWFTSNARSDLNSDGLVNAIDYSIMNSHWFQTW